MCISDSCRVHDTLLETRQEILVTHVNRRERVRVYTFASFESIFRSNSRTRTRTFPSYFSLVKTESIVIRTVANRSKRAITFDQLWKAENGRYYRYRWPDNKGIIFPFMILNSGAHLCEGNVYKIERQTRVETNDRVALWSSEISSWRTDVERAELKIGRNRSPPFARCGRSVFLTASSLQTSSAPNLYRCDRSEFNKRFRFRFECQPITLISQLIIERGKYLKKKLYRRPRFLRICFDF